MNDERRDVPFGRARSESRRSVARDARGARAGVMFGGDRNPFARASTSGSSGAGDGASGGGASASAGGTFGTGAGAASPFGGGGASPFGGGGGTSSFGGGAGATPFGGGGGDAVRRRRVGVSVRRVGVDGDGDGVSVRRGFERAVWRRFIVSVRRVGVVSVRRDFERSVRRRFTVSVQPAFVTVRSERTGRFGRAVRNERTGVFAFAVWRSFAFTVWSSFAFTVWRAGDNKDSICARRERFAVWTAVLNGSRQLVRSIRRLFHADAVRTEGAGAKVRCRLQVWRRDVGADNFWG